MEMERPEGKVENEEGLNMAALHRMVVQLHCKPLKRRKSSLKQVAMR